jgi:ParB family transcriptional regulator, chromosome partitioning protein
MPGPNGPNQHEELIMSTETQQTQFRFIGVRHLSLSPLNVRKTAADSGIEQLADLINAEGVLQNLDVYESPQGEGKKKTTHAVVAGGRRWRALQLLLKQKRIKPDFAVPCLIVSHERAVQISLTENSGRQPMHPADEFEAFRLLVDSGQSVEDVAARFSVTPLVVQRRLKLANVCPPFIALYREGEITLEHLMALAVTDDHARQQQAWASLKEYEREPYTLRRILTEREISARAPVARFVGLKAYEKAGGMVRRDLFTEDDDCFLVDADLLNRLAAEKLAKHADKIKAEGHAWIDVTPHFDYADRAALGRVQSISRDPTEEEQRQLDLIRRTRLRIHSETAKAEEDEERLADLANQNDELDAEEELLDEQRLISDPDQLAVSGAVVTIDSQGKLRIERGLLKSEDAKRFVRLPPTDREGAPPPARVHSATLIRRLTAHRTLALQAILAERPNLALVVLTHRLVLRTFFARGRSEYSALQIDATDAELRQHAADMEGCKAFAALEDRRKGLQAALPTEVETLFDWLLQQSQSTLWEFFSFCVAITLNTVQSDESPHAAAGLAHAAGLDMRDWWSPTADAYLAQVPRTRILEVVAQALTPEAAAPLVKMKKVPLAQAAERLIVGTRWLPELLRTVA